MAKPYNKFQVILVEYGKECFSLLHSDKGVSTEIFLVTKIKVKSSV